MLNFQLKQHGYSLEELESMVPYERELYCVLLRSQLEDEYRRQQETKLKHGR